MKTPFAIVAILVLICCSNEAYFDKTVKVDLLNELQSCEEENIHYSIYRVYDTTFKNYEGKIAFIVLDDKIESDSLYKVLFPEMTEKRIRVSAECLLSKSPRTKSNDGCIGSFQVKVLRIVDVKDVTNEFSYPIRN
ncbi:MAG TPA: hypothetical protein VL728_09075 [Cyclobacteriaceae bacterium]|nr:hypothetical protein [Cyclobacteriaceae bacterium]